MSSKDAGTEASERVQQGGLVPKLRFPEFRDAQAWRTVALKDVLRPTSREVAKPESSYTGLGLRSHGKGTFQKADQDPDKIAMDRLYVVHRDDLIVNITFAWEGAIAIANDSDHGLYVSHRFPTYEFKSGVSSPDFFRYVITDKAFVYRLGVISPGGAGRNRVMNKNDFLRIMTLLPSVSEQQKIADCLSSIDALIAAEAEKLEALKDHKKGLMQQLFPAPGETTPRLRFPAFQSAGDWHDKPLSAVCEMKAGKFVAAADISEQPREGLYPCYGGNGLRGYTRTYTHSGKLSLIGRQGALCGNVNFVTGDFHATEHAIVTKPKTGILGDWLYHALVRLNLNDFATGQAQPGLSVDVLEKVLCPTPRDEHEQQLIATCLSSADSVIAAQADRVAALRVHKSGLMQQLFPYQEKTEA